MATHHFHLWLNQLFAGKTVGVQFGVTRSYVQECHFEIWTCEKVTMWLVFVEFVLHPSPPQLFISRLFYSLFPPGVPREWGLCFIYQEPGLTELVDIPRLVEEMNVDLPHTPSSPQSG